MERDCEGQLGRGNGWADRQWIPTSHLLRLQSHAARRVERGDDRRVLLGALRAHDRLATPEDVGGSGDLFLHHTGERVIIVNDYACMSWDQIVRASKEEEKADIATDA